MGKPRPPEIMDVEELLEIVRADRRRRVLSPLTREILEKVEMLKPGKAVFLKVVESKEEVEKVRKRASNMRHGGILDKPISIHALQKQGKYYIYISERN